MGQVLLIMGVPLGVLLSLSFIGCGGLRRVINYWLNKRRV